MALGKYHLQPTLDSYRMVLPSNKCSVVYRKVHFVLHVPTLYISIIILDIYNQRYERLHVHLKNKLFRLSFNGLYKLCIPHHLLGPVCLPSIRCGYLIYTYVLPVALIIVSLMTGMHVRAWTVYDSCVCLCYTLIRVSCLFTSPFVPFQSSK